MKQIRLSDEAQSNRAGVTQGATARTHLRRSRLGEAHVHADQQVKITVSDGQIIITPVQDKPLTLEQRLAQFDPLKHGGEAMASTRYLGAEKW